MRTTADKYVVPSSQLSDRPLEQELFVIPAIAMLSGAALVGASAMRETAAHRGLRIAASISLLVGSIVAGRLNSRDNHSSNYSLTEHAENIKNVGVGLGKT